MSDVNADAPIPKPRITVRGVGIVAVCWLLYALLYATAIAASEATSFGNVIAGQLMSALLLALLSVPPGSWSYVKWIAWVGCGK